MTKLRFKRLTTLGQRSLSIATVGVLALGAIALPAAAVRFRDGTVQFAGVPRLGRVSTSNNQTWAWGATYWFTLQVPDDASEPLGRVTLQQTEGVDSVDFNLQRSVAFLNGDRRQSVAVETVEVGKASLALTLNPPVPPGATVTLGLRPYQNPSVGGVYLFGVTAAPAGEKVRDQFIGYGRLQFYERFFWHRHW